MTAAYVHATPNEKAISGAAALVMHGMFLALLVFGATWQKRQPEAMVVDLWNNLPPVAAPQAEVKPEARPEPRPEPEPPRPEPKVEAKPPPPRVEPKPTPKVEPTPTVKPDIALQEKKEKERKAQEQALAEKKKREQEQAQAQAKQQAQEAEAKARLAREQDEAIKKLAQQQAQQAAASQSKLVDEYIGKIQARIKARVIRTGCLSLTNPEIHLKVILLPDGNVLGDPEIRKSSGAAACDSAVARAVLAAQPLPVPADQALFQKVFRDLDLRLRPND